MKKLGILGLLATLVFTTSAFASDPFAQGDKILADKSAEKAPVLMRVHPETGETALFSAKGLDVAKAKAMQSLPEGAEKDAFVEEVVSTFEADSNRLEGKVVAASHERSTSAWYGYYYGYYPVYYYYTPTYYYYYYYSWPVYYGGYRWIILY